MSAVNALLASAIPVLFPALARKACARAGLDLSMLLDEAEGFDSAYYEQFVGRRFRSAEAGLFHYLRVGSRRGLWPRADFDPGDYRRRNPDVERAGYEPFAHYLHFGRSEGRCGTVRSRSGDETSLPLPDIAQMLRHPAANAAAAAVDVIIPVYGSRELTLQTLASVLAAHVNLAYELIVVDDASVDRALRGELELLAGKGLVTLLTNERNVGFVGSVNRGLALHGDRDVVLLNSDTRVFDGWLDRLMSALRSTPRTATATPFSNAATILSYPVTLRDNTQPSGLDFAVLDRLCAGSGQPLIELPTGVGFCMAMSRACLREVGLFDAERFGRGYGEENDFCLRASAVGWRHVAATDLFVWHRGGGSFGVEREALIAAAQATLGELHPGYGELVRDFIRRDPLQPVRAALDAARVRADPRPKVLRIGQETEAMAGSTDVLTLTLVPDIAPFFGQFRLVARAFPPVPNLVRIGPDTRPAALRRIMSDLAIREVHLGTAGSPASQISRSLKVAAEAAGVVVRPSIF